MSNFHPLVGDWFTARYGEPTEPQVQGWPLIRAGRDVLISAPTGSGKTLAAFTLCLDDLIRRAAEGPLPDETVVVYVSPLKALTNDIRKNLETPLGELLAAADERGLALAPIRTATRTGDTPQAERARMLRKPPHVLVTTPESLFILLTAEKSRALFSRVQTVIVDEIHAMAADKRGSHLALTLARLDELVMRESGRKPQRIGLSATVRPLADVARFLSPKAQIVDVGHRRAMTLAVEVPNDELSSVASSEMSQEIYDRLAELIRAHRTTLVFVSTRRMSERVTFALQQRLGEGVVMPHHGSLARELRFDAENRLKNGDLKAVVATASLELGIDIGSIDLVVQLGSPRSIAVALQRIGRSGHWVGATPEGRLFATTRDELLECAALVRSIRSGAMDALKIPSSPLDILAQQLVAMCAADDWDVEELYALVRNAYPYRDLARKDFDEVLAMLADGVATSRGRSGAFLHHDKVNGRVRARRGARMAAITSGGAIPETANYNVVVEPDGHVIGTVDEDFAVESMAGDIFLLGTTSWQIRRVEPGVVRVADAHGAPPSIPFWNGEGLGRTIELSHEVAALRAAIDERDDEAAVQFLIDECGLDRGGADQAVAYVRAGKAILGTVPTDTTIVAERFFDEAGGMQLILHTPFGARINRGWGLALRKKFCRSFNIELQAAATDNGVVPLAERPARVSARDRLRVRQVRQRRADAHASAARGADVRRALALERDPRAGDPAHARRQEGRTADPADARRRSARIVLPRRGGVRGEPDRPDPHPRPRAGARDDRQLLARGDGSRRAHRGAARRRERRDQDGRRRHARALAVLPRDPQREPVRVPRRRAARRAPRARRHAAPHDPQRRRCGRRHPRSGRDRRSHRVGVAGRARRRRAARCARHARRAAAGRRVDGVVRRTGRTTPRDDARARRRALLDLRRTPRHRAPRVPRCDDRAGDRRRSAVAAAARDAAKKRWRRSCAAGSSRAARSPSRSSRERSPSIRHRWRWR